MSHRSGLPSQQPGLLERRHESLGSTRGAACSVKVYEDAHREHPVDGSSECPGEVTRLVRAWNSGDKEALGELVGRLHRELRRLAAVRMQKERVGHTLEPTAVVHELYLKLLASDEIDCQNRAHFLAVAGVAMGRLLVDYARKHRAKKRGGDFKFVGLDEAFDLPVAREIDSAAVGCLLLDLDAIDDRKRTLVELRVFGGLTFEECAEKLGVAPRTLKRDWRFVRAWSIDYFNRGDDA